MKVHSAALGQGQHRVGNHVEIGDRQEPVKGEPGQRLCQIRVGGMDGQACL